MKALLLLLLLTNQPSCIGNLNTPGCKSFREMVNMKDKDLTEQITPPSNAYVCFTPKIDEFTVISFYRPEESDFEQDVKNQYIWTSQGVAGITTYLDGVENYSVSLIGTWTAYNKAFKAASFTTATEDPKNSSPPEPALHLDSSEVDTSFSYKNASGELVSIGIKVRRSTLRFQRLFQFPVGVQQMTSTDNGYCTEFK